MKRERLFLALFLVVFASIASAQPFAPAPLAPPPPPPPGPDCWPPTPLGLANWWTFDEPAGVTSSDFGGSINNIGSDHAAVPRVIGEVGRAVSFDGTSKWVEVADSPELNFAGDCTFDAAESATIDLWVRTTNNAGVNTILDKRDTTGPNFLRGYSLYLWNGHLGFQIATGPGDLLCNSPGSACTNTIATTLPSVADGDWHFIAVTFSRCRGAVGMFYVDGLTAPFSSMLVGDMTSTSNLFIGRRSPPFPPGYFRGEIDELQFFKVPLSALDLDGIRSHKTAGMCRYY